MRKYRIIPCYMYSDLQPSTKNGYKLEVKTRWLLFTCWREIKRLHDKSKLEELLKHIVLNKSVYYNYKGEKCL